LLKIPNLMADLDVRSNESQFQVWEKEMEDTAINKALTLVLK